MTPEANAAFLNLDPNKQDIVRELSNAVILAGPGSGKTATLTVKAAYLASDVVSPPRGVACLTYGREAAAEFTSRLKSYGIHPSYRLFLGTVHGFCLGKVLIPFGLLGHEGQTRRIATATQVQRLIASAVADADSDENPEYIEATLTRIRRSAACGEPTHQFSDELRFIANRLDELMALRGLIDFEGLVNLTVEAIRLRPMIRAVLAARYPWLLVDEYQDLGGPLHAIVTSMTDGGGVSAFVVGDPDQSIYGFTGADPRYLLELAARPEFVVHRLEFNYRAGSALIAASEAVAVPGREVRYRAAPDRVDPGELYLEDVPGGLAGQAEHVVSAILPQLRLEGIDLHEIAVLYPYQLSRAPEIPSALLQKLEDAGVPYSFDRDRRHRGNPFVRWLRACAAWSVGGPSRDFDPCLAFYRDLLAETAQLAGNMPSLAQRVALLRALRSADRAESAGHWLALFSETLGLLNLLRAAPAHDDDAEILQNLLESLDVALMEFAADSRSDGRLVVGTYHGSKGRQFDAVILPWLQLGVLPRESWSAEYRAFRPAPARQIDEERRLLYVALTRARRFVFLVSSRDAVDTRGRRLNPSPFIGEIERRTLLT